MPFARSLLCRQSLIYVLATRTKETGTVHRQSCNVFDDLSQGSEQRVPQNCAYSNGTSAHLQFSSIYIWVTTGFFDPVFSCGKKKSNNWADTLNMTFHVLRGRPRSILRITTNVRPPYAFTSRLHCIILHDYSLLLLRPIASHQTRRQWYRRRQRRHCSVCQQN